jgi:hypothetical protein
MEPGLLLTGADITDWRPSSGGGAVASRLGSGGIGGTRPHEAGCAGLTCTRICTSSAKNTLKAIVQLRYGSSDVLELREVETPAISPGEVLVRVEPQQSTRLIRSS